MPKFRNDDINENLKELAPLFDKVDSTIKLPDSLLGKNLLSTIENVEQDPKTEDRAKEKRTYFISWQAMVAYAAIFLVMVVSIRTIPSLTAQNKNELAAASGSVEPSAKAVTDEHEVAASEEAYSLALESAEDTAVYDSNETVGAETAEQKDSYKEASPETGGADGASGDLLEAVGGSGASTSLGLWGTKNIAWRANDPTDPDKSGKISVEIVDNKTGENTQIDLEEINNIKTFYTQGDKMVLGGSTELGYGVKVYSSSQGSLATESSTLSQPGKVIFSTKEGEILYTITTGSSLSDGWENMLLPTSSENGHIFVSAVDLSTGNITKLALQGSNGYSVKLKGNIITVTYKGTEAEEKVTEIEYTNGEFNII